VFEDDLQEARQCLTDRVADLEQSIYHLSPRTLFQEVHSIKGLAQAFGFRVAAGLLHALEDDLQRNGRSGPLLAYLDRTQEAIESDTLDDPAYLELLLASVSARLSAA
jgi:HPt (histidine-containing phosphotransfer) domain-containing protein